MHGEITKKERLLAYIASCVGSVILLGVFMLLLIPRATPSPFVTVQECGDYKIVYDRDTKVMYNMTDGKYNAGQLYKLYNRDGSLKIYDGK